MISLSSNPDQVFAQDKAIVWFTARWCAPCKQIAPVVQQIANQIPIPIYVVDIDQLGGFAAQMNVATVPSFRALHRGQVVDTQIGANPHALWGMVWRLRDR